MKCGGAIVSVREIGDGDGGATWMACSSSSCAMPQTMMVLGSARAMKAAALPEAFGEVGDGDGGATQMARCSSSRSMPRTMKVLGSARAMKCGGASLGPRWLEATAEMRRRLDGLAILRARASGNSFSRTDLGARRGLNLIINNQPMRRKSKINSTINWKIDRRAIQQPT